MKNIHPFILEGLTKNVDTKVSIVNNDKHSGQGCNKFFSDYIQVYNIYFKVRFGQLNSI